MSLLSRISEGTSRWLDRVAETLAAAFGRLRSRKAVRLIERADGDGFAMEHRSGTTVRLDAASGADPVASAVLRGARVELVLRPDRFLVRSQHWPRRAADFLDGIVREQIDRLTPWRAEEAVFGHGEGVEAERDQIRVTVVATARSALAHLIEACLARGAVAVSAGTQVVGLGGAVESIQVYDGDARASRLAGRLRRALASLLLAAALAAGLAMPVSAIVADRLASQQEELARRIGAQRIAIRRGAESAALSAGRKVQLRKEQSPSPVVVIEALSAILPDHSYLTMVRIDDDKLQIAGVTRDAPELVRLIEQAPQFSEVVFAAPTTREGGSAAERFQIAARIAPLAVAGP